MTKNIFYLLLFILPIFVLTSCGDDKEALPFYSEDGRWKIDSKQRVIECFGVDEESDNKAKALQTELQNRFRQQAETYNYEYLFETLTEKYAEELFKKDSNLGIADISLPGEYKRRLNLITATITNQGALGNWETEIHVEDINSEFMMLTQDLDAKDLQNMLYLYFGIHRVLDTKITGKMTTKSWKIQN